MESKILAVVLTIILLLCFIFVSGTGCGEASAEAQAQELNSELNSLEDLSNEIDNLNMNEFSESELENLEGII